MDQYFKHVIHPINREKFVLPVILSQEKFNSALSYKPDDSDILVCSYPKCGTTWLQNLTWLITRNGKPMDTNIGLIDQLPYLECMDSTLIKNADNSVYPRIIKTHFPRKWLPWNPHSRYLLIVRDPRDVATSLYFHFVGFEYTRLKFTPEDTFDCFINGKFQYGDYFEFLQGYLSSKDSNILILYYEDLQKDLGKEIWRIAKFLGSEYEENLLKNDQKIFKEIIKKSHISEMRKNDKHWCSEARLDGWPFIRKGEVGDWKNYLTNEQVELLLERLKQTVPQLEQFWWGDTQVK